jgi:hypothetical protein
MTRRPLTQAVTGKARTGRGSPKPSARQDRSAVLEPEPASRAAVKPRLVQSSAKDRPAKDRPARTEAAKPSARPATEAPVAADLVQQQPAPPATAKRRSGRRGGATQVPAAAEAQPSAPAKQPARPVMKRPIMVELNAVAEGWTTRSRFDLVLLGQISSVAPIDAFSIRDPFGLELAAVQFGQNDY